MVAEKIVYIAAVLNKIVKTTESVRKNVVLRYFLLQKLVDGLFEDYCKLIFCEKISEIRRSWQKLEMAERETCVQYISLFCRIFYLNKYSESMLEIMRIYSNK